MMQAWADHLDQLKAAARKKAEGAVTGRAD
jgi:hypothetical protein